MSGLRKCSLTAPLFTVAREMGLLRRAVYRSESEVEIDTAMESN